MPSPTKPCELTPPPCKRPPLRPLLLLSFLFLASLANAGYYRITVSGGEVESTGAGGGYAHAYAHSAPTTSAGGVATASGHVDSGGYDQTANPLTVGYGGASCTGTITSSFVWMPDSPGDDAPPAVVVHERASASGEGDSGAYDDGLGHSDSGMWTRSASGDRYQVKGGGQLRRDVRPVGERHRELRVRERQRRRGVRRGLRARDAEPRWP